ncbi:MAG: outer membrane protein assembly factor BamC [Gammaproteobacteria bacterium]|nr:MAG: outer membrane protein assembly factor BamC [Gammaproteobacteria bacterium]
MKSPFFPRAFVLALLTMLLSGCSWFGGDDGWFRDRSDDYREARPVPPPVIPSDLDDIAIGEAMFIPDVPGMERYLEDDDFELPRPATLFAREEDRGVRIQRFADASWVVAPDPPSLVWPRIMQFLADNGVAVDREQPEAGILETQWIEVRGDRFRDIVRSVLAEEAGDVPLHRLRLDVGQAVRRGATEISLIHAGTDGMPVDLPWPERSTSARAEEVLLNELAGYLAAEVGQAGISLRAQNIAAEPKAEVLAGRDRPPVLRFRLDYDRAWATVATALTNAEIPVLDSDSLAGSYQISFDEGQFRGEEMGWFRRTFSFRARGGEELELRLEPADDGFDLRVLGPDGQQSVGREQAEQVLTIVREFAS